MEIYQIIHFIAIVETGSFTKGADRAAVSQSAISASIAKLEAEFDVQLLDRRSPVVPTNAGARLFEAGKAILQICSALKGELETIARPMLLRIGILQFQAAGFFPARQLSCGDRGVRWVQRAIGRIAR
jgi:DNA-binding transcriptional LysR family regulator